MWFKYTLSLKIFIFKYRSQRELGSYGYWFIKVTGPELLRVRQPPCSFPPGVALTEAVSLLLSPVTLRAAECAFCDMVTPTPPLSLLTCE